MALTGTFKLARDGMVEFAKQHALAVLMEPKLSDIAQAKPNDRHTILGDKRLYSAVLRKRSVPTDSANLAYVVEDFNRFTAGMPAIGADRFLTWYLPWNPGGGQNDMTIPDTPVLDQTGQNLNPPLFLTTTLSGCSVFIRGKDTRPEVFHSGSAAKVDWEGTASTHWRQLFAATRPGTYQRGTFTEVNKLHYGSPKAFGQRFNSPLVESYIQQLQAFEAHRGLPFVLIDYMGMGCVFGVRDNSGKWAFYLQEIVRVGYSRSTGPLPTLVWANRALRLTQVHPSNSAIFTNTVPKPIP